MTDRDHLDLIARFLDDRLDPDDADRLADRLADDPQLRQALADHAMLSDRLSAAMQSDRSRTAFTEAMQHRAIAEDDPDFRRHVMTCLHRTRSTEAHGLQSVGSATPTPVTPPPDESTARVQALLRKTDPIPFTTWLAAAACIGVVVLLGIFGYLLKAVYDAPSGAPNPPDLATVAVLFEVSDDAEYTFDGPADHDQITPGGHGVPAGIVELTRGTMSFKFHSGADVTLEGPATFRLNSAMAARLDVGTLTVHCDEQTAKGFAVAAPGCTVVDLGTRFRMIVDPLGMTDVAVTEGRVDLRHDNGDVVALTRGARAQASFDFARRIGPHPAVLDPRTPPVDPAAFADAIHALRPVVYWTGEKPTDGVALDAILQRPATVEGVVATGGADDNPHYRFDGSGYLTVADSALNAPGTQLSVIAWVKLDTTDHQAIVHKWSDGLGYSLEIHHEKPGFVVAFANDRSQVIHVSADETMPVGRWVHLAGVYDGQTVSIYVDGRRAGSRPAPEIDAAVNESFGPLFIGRRSAHDVGRLGEVRGGVDDVAIFDRALSPEQIRALSPPHPVTNPSVSQGLRHGEE